MGRALGADRLDYEIRPDPEVRRDTGRDVLAGIEDGLGPLLDGGVPSAGTTFNRDDSVHAEMAQRREMHEPEWSTTDDHRGRRVVDLGAIERAQRIGERLGERDQRGLEAYRCGQHVFGANRHERREPAESGCSRRTEVLGVSTEVTEPGATQGA